MRWIVGLGAAVAVFVVGVGLVLWLAVSQAASFASRAAAPLLEAGRATVEAALPADLSPEQVRLQIDGALASLRDGRVDGAALREVAVWLPAALLDGQLDAAEGAALWDKLQRIAPSEPAAEGS